MGYHSLAFQRPSVFSTFVTIEHSPMAHASSTVIYHHVYEEHHILGAKEWR